MSTEFSWLRWASAGPHGAGRLNREAGKVEAKFGYVPLRSIQEGQTRGDRGVRKEMNHSPLYLANSLIGIGRSDC